MAVLALAAVGAGAGAAIGSAIGFAAIGASIGWTVGSVVGQALFSPKTNVEGPRLSQIRYTNSAFGTTLPIVLGGFRVGAQVIWMGPVAERANRQRVGKNAYQTSYTYQQSFAIALSEGPVEGIRRVWFDNVLVYSAVYGDVVEAYDTGSMEELMTIYLGDELQEPDSLIEAVEGVGNVPAYRGVSYIVFRDLNLTPWGNRIPSINVEVIEKGAYEVPTRISELELGGDNVGAQWLGNTTDIEVTGWRNGPATANSGLFEAWITNAEAGGDQSRLVASETFVYRGDGVSAALLQQVHGTPNVTVTNSFPAICLNDPRIAFQHFGDLVNSPDVDYEPRGGWMLRQIDNGMISNCLVVYTDLHWCLDVAYRHRDRIYFVGKDASGSGAYLRCQMVNRSDVDWFPTSERTPLGAFNFPTGLVFQVDLSAFGTLGSGGAAWVGVDEITGDVYVHWSALTIGLATPLLRFDADGNIKTWYNVGGGRFAVWNDMVCYVVSFGESAYTMEQARLLEDADWPNESSVEVLNTAQTTTWDAWPQEPHIINLGNGVFVDQIAEWSMARYFTDTGRTLAECIEAITDRVGVSSAERNVNQVTTITVPGYVIDRRMAARSALEPLLVGFGVDGAESAGVLRFVPRGGASSGTIYHDDLGAERDAHSPDESIAVSSTREQEAPLPQQVDLVYASVGSDYQSGTIIAKRGQILSDEKITAELPIAMTDAQAAEAANRLLYDAWAGRTKREFSTSVKYAAFEPADVVMLEESTSILTRLRITGRSEDDGIIKWEAVADDDGVPVQYAVGVQPHEQQTIPKPRPATYPVLFEVPALSDADASQAVIYVIGVATSSERWNSATIVRSDIADTNFSQINDITALSIGGTVQTPLPDWDETRLAFDQSTFTANVVGGAPPAVSVDDQLLGDGLMVVGGELIRYRTATLVSGTTYLFSGLQRGIRGTDYAADDHGEGSEFFALLPDTSTDSIARVVQDISTVGTSSRFRAVTSGQLIVDSPSTPWRFTGRTLLPLPVVHVHIVRQANGDRTFRWIRRARAYQGWGTTLGVPLVETTESYRYEIIDADTEAVLRTGTVSTNSLTYTAAQHESDFPYPPTQIRIKIWQQSALLGDGELRDQTMNWPGNFNNYYSDDFESGVGDFTGFSGDGGIDTTSNGGSTRLWLRLFNSTYDVKARNDVVGQIVDGRIAADVRCPYDLAAGGKNGLLARTTNFWTGGQNGFGWFAYLTNDGKVGLGYGTNANSNTFVEVAISAAVYSSQVYVSLVYEFIGSRHRVWADDELMIDVTNTTYQSTSGYVGHRHQQNGPSSDYQDNVEVFY